MRYLVWGLIVVACLCFGQTCSGPIVTNPIPLAGDTTGSPAPVNWGIPQGTYIGQRTCQAITDIVGDDEPPTETTTTQLYSQSFGADGTLVGPGGYPTVIGGQRTNTVGTTTLKEVVQQVNVGQNQLSIITDATMTMMNYPVLGQLTLTGFGQETYSYEAPNIVQYESFISLASPPIGGLIVTIEYRYSGTLTK